MDETDEDAANYHCQRCQSIISLSKYDFTYFCNPGNKAGLGPYRHWICPACTKYNFDFSEIGDFPVSAHEVFYLTRPDYDTYPDMGYALDANGQYEDDRKGAKP